MSKYRQYNTGIQDKSEKTMKAVARRCSFYRENPHRFVKDYLGIELKMFQEIILVMMFSNIKTMFLAARGIGKTFLTAIFCVVKCILYPGIKICVASKTLKQAKEVLKKITSELLPNSPNLRLEIKQIMLNSIDAQIEFKNGSIIYVTTATDTARGGRCHILIVDEFRLVKKDVIDMILKPFMRSERSPKYLDKKEYAHLQSERNQEIYMSSVWYKSHWAFKEAQAFVVDMMNDIEPTFICGLPYQLAVKERLLNPVQVLGDMMKPTFDEISFSMESGCLWWGESESSFFKFEDLLKSRCIKNALYPKELYSKISNKIIQYPDKIPGEIRLLSADIAIMSSRKNKNDATAVFVLQLIPTKNAQYIRNVLYTETAEGQHTEDQAIMIRRLYEQMDCDYIVLDTQGVGSGVYDNLVKDMTDNVTGEFYPALTCINDPEMAARYKGAASNPPKVIYSIKASSKWNSQCAYALRDCIRRGKMRLLVEEEEFDDHYDDIKEFAKLSEQDKLDIKMPFIQTSLLINELVNLEYTTVGTDIKIRETGDKRKDRYSSLSYANQIANELEQKLSKPKSSDPSFRLQFRSPKCMQIAR